MRVLALVISVSLMGCVSQQDVTSRVEELESGAGKWKGACQAQSEKEFGDLAKSCVLLYGQQLDREIEKALREMRSEYCSKEPPTGGLDYPRCIREATESFAALKNAPCPENGCVKETLRQQSFLKPAPPQDAAEEEAKKKRAKEKAEAWAKIQAQKEKLGCVTLMGATVTQKLSADVYELYFPCLRDPETLKCHNHVLLKPTITKVEAGALPHVATVKKGMQKVRLQNGFEGEYPVYQETKACTELLQNEWELR